jgi:hypothetical protein
MYYVIRDIECPYILAKYRSLAKAKQKKKLYLKWYGDSVIIAKRVKCGP